MVAGLTLPEFKTCYKETVRETMWYEHNERQMDQWKETSTEISLYIYEQLNFDNSMK